MDTSESHAGAVERFQAAREERDQRAVQYDATSASPSELAAFTELWAPRSNSARGKHGSSGSRGTTRS
jgi:hypothetical protein